MGEVEYPPNFLGTTKVQGDLDVTREINTEQINDSVRVSKEDNISKK